jgi:hypothetical protein
MLEGRSFHNSGAALEKALFPYALSLKEVLVKKLDDEDLKEREGTYDLIKSQR